MSNVLRLDDYREKIAQEKPIKEVKKVSIDDGFIQIPRELYLAIARFPFTKHQRAVVDAVIIKCLGYHKEMDWIGNSQIIDLTTIDYECKASTAKQELIRMNVLVQKGKSIGFNLVVSEWESDLPKQENIYQNSKKSFTKTVNRDLPKKENTKENITKEKINITPLPPKSELACSEEKNLSQAQELLAHYNEIAKSHCKDSSPFLPLLEKNHYTVDEIKLVINWVLTCWNRRNGKPAKPKNICVKSRFDGYLSDAITWNERRSLCKDVVDAYNEILGDRLVPMDEVDQLAESQISALLPHLARQDIDGFRSYFQAFSDNAREYYFRPENKYGFSYLMKPETLFKTRRGEL